MRCRAVCDRIKLQKTGISLCIVFSCGSARRRWMTYCRKDDSIGTYLRECISDAPRRHWVTIPDSHLFIGIKIERSKGRKKKTTRRKLKSVSCSISILYYFYIFIMSASHRMLQNVCWKIQKITHWHFNSMRTVNSLRRRKANAFGCTVRCRHSHAVSSHHRE